MYLDFITDIAKIGDTIRITCQDEIIEGAIVKIAPNLIAVRLNDGTLVIKKDDEITDLAPDCSNNGGDNGGNGGGNTGSDTTTVTHGDTVYVYVTIHDTIHDTVCPEVNSISPTVISDINIYTVERQIVVEGAASMPVAFYDMQGRTLETKQSRNDQPVRFDAPATGVYMIRVANLPAQRVAILR